MSRLILLSGPSCVGKGPMTQALDAYCRSIGTSLVKHVLYNDRPMRIGEVDGTTYHFLSNTTMREMKASDADRYHLFDLSETNSQMMDKKQLKEELDRHDLVFLEILLSQVEFPKMIARERGCTVKEIFITPLSEQDFFDLNISEEQRGAATMTVMLSKLINRGTEDRADQLKRARRAADEVHTARERALCGKCVLFPNHFGEDNRHLWRLLHHAIQDGRWDQPNELLGQPGGPELIQTFQVFCDLVLP